MNTNPIIVLKQAEREFKKATQALIGDEFIINDDFMEDLYVEIDGITDGEEKYKALEELLLRKGYEWDDDHEKFRRIEG